jgi:hypothetical protein
VVLVFRSQRDAEAVAEGVGDATPLATGLVTVGVEGAESGLGEVLVR